MRLPNSAYSRVRGLVPLPQGGACVANSADQRAYLLQHREGFHSQLSEHLWYALKIPSNFRDLPKPWSPQGVFDCCALVKRPCITALLLLVLAEEQQGYVTAADGS